jgi:hypothetical protein
MSAFRQTIPYKSRSLSLNSHCRNQEKGRNCIFPEIVDQRIEVISALGDPAYASIFLLLDMGMNAPKFLAAEVTAVCSTMNLKLMHSLGADDVINYMVEDFIRTD